jgi:hypothetical protein
MLAFTAHSGTPSSARVRQHCLSPARICRCFTSSSALRLGPTARTPTPILLSIAITVSPSVEWAQLSVELTGVTAATRVDSDRYEVVLSAARRAAATLRGDTGGDEKYDDAALGLGNERPPLLSLQPVGSTLGIFTSRTISQQRLWCACGALDQDNRLAGSTSFCSGKTQVLGASPWMPLQHDAAASRWAGQVLASPHMRVGQVPVVACRPSTSNQSTPAERAASELASLSQLAPAPAEPRWGLTNKSCAMSAGRQAAMGGALRTLERSPPASR